MVGVGTLFCADSLGLPLSLAFCFGVSMAVPHGCGMEVFVFLDWVRAGMAGREAERRAREKERKRAGGGGELAAAESWRRRDDRRRRARGGRRRRTRRRADETRRARRRRRPRLFTNVAILPLRTTHRQQRALLLSPHTNL
jgi:hypothetical protein